MICPRCKEWFQAYGNLDFNAVGNSTSDTIPRKKIKYCPMCGNKL